MHDNYDKTGNTLLVSLTGTSAALWIRDRANNSLEKLLIDTVPINSIFKEGAEKVLKANKIKHFNPNNKNVMEQILDGLTVSESFKLNLEEAIAGAKEGTNAVSFVRRQGVLVDLDKSAALTFHEAAHVMNSKSNLGKVRQLAGAPRIQKFGLGIAFASALLIPAKKDSEQGFIGKSLQFLRDNCVGIATLTVLPVGIEETIANVKGCQLAKTVLSKDACKIVNKLNTKSAIAYISSCLASVLGVFVAKKGRELIDIKKTGRDN